MLLLEDTVVTRTEAENRSRMSAAGWRVRSRKEGSTEQCRVTKKRSRMIASLNQHENWERKKKRVSLQLDERKSEITLHAPHETARVPFPAFSDTRSTLKEMKMSTFPFQA